MKYLITGGAGFIGSNFVKMLFQRKDSGQQEIENIIVFDKLTYAGNKNNLKEFTVRKDYLFVKGDLLDTDLLEETVLDNDIDVIVNFAAETHVDRSILGPRDFINTNIVGTFNLLEILRNYPEIRLHHISTDEVFGELPLDKPDEKFEVDTPYNPKSPYSASKAASDHLVRSYISTYQVQATISNCSNNFGPYCYPEKLIPLVITRAIYEESIPVYGNGGQIRDWIHVEDHCRAIELVLSKGKLGETYLFGGDGERTNLWIVKHILKRLNKSEDLIKFVGDRKGHDVRYAIDFSKAEQELGYRPEKSIEEWLNDTIDWYRDNEQWWLPHKKDADKIAEKYLKQ